MKQHLQHSVNEHLESVQLDESRLRELERLQRRPAARHGWRNPALAAAVAACVIAVVTVAVLPLRTPWSLHEPAIAVAEEVAINHLKRRPLEVRGDRLAALAGYFDALGFRLVDTRRPALGAQLLGGRYCSVQGVTAAQLRRRDPAGRTQTLYQVPYDAARFGVLPDVGRGETPRSLQVHGLNVDLWVERGLLFALTREE